MPDETELLESITSSDYKYGFVTDIEQEMAPISSTSSINFLSGYMILPKTPNPKKKSIVWMT